MTLLWVDASAGASGDMLLGALVGAGADLAAVQAAVDALGTEPVRLTAGQVTRAGLAATKVDVAAPASDVRRTWPDVRALIEGAGLDTAVRDRALDVFARLARAEGAAHGVDPEQVHFHEVGALDSLADVVGTCAALHDLGVSEVRCTAVAVGQGTVRTEHGLLPVPGPAVLAVLAEAGAPVGSGDVDGEACTPTGAALLAAVVSSWGAMPTMRVQATGTGAGGRDPEGRPNVLRIVLGEHAAVSPDPAAESEVVLEANVDDLDPRVWPSVLAAPARGGRVRRVADADPDEEGPTGPHALGAGAGGGRRGRTPGRVHRELDDRCARAPGRQAGAAPRDPHRHGRRGRRSG